MFGKHVLGYMLSWDISVCRRNELVALDLFLTAVATAFAFVSMVGEGPDPPDIQDYELHAFSTLTAPKEYSCCVQVEYMG